jgi:hypothetical protein
MLLLTRSDVESLLKKGRDLTRLVESHGSFHERQAEGNSWIIEVCRLMDDPDLLSIDRIGLRQSADRLRQITERRVGVGADLLKECLSVIVATLDNILHGAYDFRDSFGARDSDISQAKRSVCILEGVDDNNTPFCATAFSIGFGLYISCAHCLGKDLKMYRRERPKEPHFVRVVREIREKDLVILDVPTLELPPLPVARVGILDAGRTMTILGFPDYAPGNDVQQVPVTITGHRMLFGIDLMVVNGGIRAGMSGGPAIVSGQVAGIAQRGGKSHDDTEREHQGVIPSEYIYDAVRELISRSS